MGGLDLNRLGFTLVIYSKNGVFGVLIMSVTVSIKVKRELIELAEKMIRYGLAKSRSNAFNLMIEKGLEWVKKEVEFWDKVYEKVKELEKKKVRLEHGKLNELLAEDRAR